MYLPLANTLVALMRAEVGQEQRCDAQHMHAVGSFYIVSISGNAKVDQGRAEMQVGCCL